MVTLPGRRRSGTVGAAPASDRPRSGSGRDGVLVHRAARRIGVQTGALVFVAFCLCAGVLLLLVFHSQHNASQALLRSAVARADDVNDPPNGTWLVVRAANGSLATTPGSPKVLPYSPALEAVTAERPNVTNEVHTPDGEYRLLTTWEAGRVVQAAQSLATEHAERRRLLEALAVVGAVAIGAAGVLGALAARRSVAPLADALARQRAFVADASHELRTPLTHLTTRAQLLARRLRRGGAEDIAAAREDSERLVADGQQLSATLEDLLLTAEPADPSEWASVGLDDVARAGAATVATDAAEAGVTVTAVPAASGPDRPAVRVRAPRTTLDRAVLALLDNAIRHTPRGGNVTVAVTGDKHWSVLTVRDTGSGIPEAEREHIFDRFAHGSAAHGERRRFGLGLALVADTAERLGGELAVESAEGQGTAMIIRLPRAF